MQSKLCGEPWPSLHRCLDQNHAYMSGGCVAALALRTLGMIRNPSAKGLLPQAQFAFPLTPSSPQGPERQLAMGPHLLEPKSLSPVLAF